MNPTEFAVELTTPGEVSGIAARIARLVNRPAVPVLHGVLLSATESGLRAAGFNYETALTRRLTAEVHTPGTVLVSAKLLSDVTKTLPARPVTLAVDEDGNYLRVQCGSVRARLPLLPVEDYPRLPAMPEPVGEVDAAELVTATAQIAHAVSTTDVVNFAGVHLHLGCESLRLHATDRYRLARVGMAFTPVLTDTEEQQQYKLRVEHAPLHDTAKSARGGTVQLAVDDNLVGLVTSHEQVLLRQLDNTSPPALDGVLDRVRGEVATMSVDELSGAAKRAQVYGDGAAVAVEVTENTMTITTTSPDLGDNVETLAIDYTGPDSRFGINPTYLGSALAALDAERAAVTVPSSPGSALQLIPLTSEGTPRPDHVQVLMPLRLSGGQRTAA